MGAQGVWPSGKVQQKARPPCHPGQTAAEAEAKATLLICMQESSNPLMVAMEAMAGSCGTGFCSVSLQPHQTRQLHRAQNGGPGGNQKKVGRHGADKVIQVCPLLIFIAVLRFPHWSCCMLSSSHRCAISYDSIDIRQWCHWRCSSRACCIHTHYRQEDQACICLAPRLKTQ